MSLTGPELAPASGHVKHLVLFLHGLGSDGEDLIGLADALDLPDTQFVSPNAPFPCDMAPYGYQWFSLQDRGPEAMAAGVQQAAPRLNAFIDVQMARFGVAASQVALVGFSQGSMMSLYCAPRRKETLAGVVAISGAMIGAETLDAELKSRPSICLIHGTYDNVVPFVAMQAAQTTLKAHGIPVESHARPGLGHGIDEAGIGIMSAFLKRCFTR